MKALLFLVIALLPSLARGEEACREWRLGTDDVFMPPRRGPAATSHSTNGRYVLNTSDWERIEITDLETGVTSEVKSRSFLSMAMSPDGQKLAIITNQPRSLVIIDVVTGQQTVAATFRGQVDPSNLRFLSDGKRLLLERVSQDVSRIFDLSTQKTTSLSGVTEYEQFSPDERFVLTKGNAGIQDLQTGKFTKIPMKGVQRAQWSPDGSAAFLWNTNSSGMAEFHKYRLSDRRLELVHSQSITEARDFHIFPDGNRMIEVPTQDSFERYAHIRKDGVIETKIGPLA